MVGKAVGGPVETGRTLGRSDLNHGFNLVLQKENGVWKVTAWEFDLSSRYNSINHYNPELKNQWKVIENP